MLSVISNNGSVYLLVRIISVKKVLANGKNEKSPVQGVINLELIKFRRGKIRKLITRLLNTMVQERNVQEEMNRLYISSITKEKIIILKFKKNLYLQFNNKNRWQISEN